jgi:SAM-dependent methyltransferase
MHLALDSEPSSVLSQLRSLASNEPESDASHDLLRLAERHAATLMQVRLLAERGLIDIEGARGVAGIRRLFDHAVAVAPEASVALYSLGSPDILERATEEIVIRLAAWDLLGKDRAALDIGCGIGRLERALAARLGSITGIDVSQGMIDEARRRCEGLANVGLRVCTGHDLAELALDPVDLVLAVDVFPYLVAAGWEIADRHVRDAARILRPGGSLAIFNFSYRGDHEADRADVAGLASRHGFRIQRHGAHDFTLWDGVTYLLTREADRAA